MTSDQSSSEAFKDPADPAAALDFLERIQPSQPWLLYVFKSDGGGDTEAYRFYPNRKADLLKRLNVWDRAGRNVYFLLAHNRQGAARTKKDIVGADLVWTDIDPEGFDWKDKGALASWQEQTQLSLERDLPDGAPGPPTFLWSSGRGFWAAWRLAATLTDIQQLEEVCRALARAFGGDAAHDCSRVARLVGTRNQKTGRVSRLIRHRPEQVYPIAAFEREAKSALAPCEPITVEAGAPIDDLSTLSLPLWLKDLTLHGVDAPAINSWVKETKKPKDHSAQLWRAVRAYVRCGLSDSTILALILDKRYRISEHLLGGKHFDPALAARRTLSRAHASLLGDNPSAQEDAGEKS